MVLVLKYALEKAPVVPTNSMMLNHKLFFFSENQVLSYKRKLSYTYSRNIFASSNPMG